LESLTQPYFGAIGNPKPVCPEITYPPGGIISLDAQNTGTQPILGLTFYWMGVSLYPWGVLPAPTYPAKFAGETFSYPFVIHGLNAPESGATCCSRQTGTDTSNPCGAGREIQSGA
jgi:hypothetical protein